MYIYAIWFYGDIKLSGHRLYIFRVGSCANNCNAARPNLCWLNKSAI